MSERCRDRSRSCPRCRTPMAPELEGSLELDRCETCSGLFFDARELEAYARRRGVGGVAILSDLGSAPTSSRLHCPSCPDSFLVPASTVRLRLAACRSCHGVFVDGSEIPRLGKEGRSCWQEEPPPPSFQEFLADETLGVIEDFLLDKILSGLEL